MNYGQLKAMIARRLMRNNLTADIPDYISLGESRIYSGFKDFEAQVRPLRLRSMLAVETASLATLPAGFLECARFTVPGNPNPLAYKTPEEFARLSPSASFPRYYTFQDGGARVEGGTPASFVFSYYKRFPDLSAESDTNWLLTNFGGIYLYSALIEAYAATKNDARVMTAARMYAAAANALIDADDAERHSGSVLTIPVPVAI